jgi:hypothetical protein
MFSSPSMPPKAISVQYDEDSDDEPDWSEEPETDVVRFMEMFKNKSDNWLESFSLMGEASQRILAEREAAESGRKSTLHHKS